MKPLVVAAAALRVVLTSQRPTVRATVDTVEVYVTVSHRDGRLVPDLSREQFELVSDGAPVELTIFSNEIKPITVVMLLDTSGSLASRLLWFRESARSFVAALQDADRARIGSCGEEIAISPHLTARRDLLERVLCDEIWPGPGAGTPLWAALAEGRPSTASRTPSRSG